LHFANYSKHNGGVKTNPLGDLGQTLGEYLREQRQAARLSVRQLSELAGVSNPYLSQIERGLKKPSAEILNQLAKGLQVSSESLYIRAGLLDAHEGSAPARPETRAVIKSDPRLTSRQKSTLLAVYDSFVDAESTPTPPEIPASEPAQAPRPARKRAAAKAPAEAAAQASHTA